MSEQLAPKAEVLLRCIAGPDRGMRFALSDGEVVLGKSSECNLLSDDPDVSEQHVSFARKDGKLTFRAHEDCNVFVDGPRLESGTLEAQQQLRIGPGLACILAGHTLWTAIVGAALWLVKGERKFGIDMVFDARFVRVLGIAMVLHMVNNTPIANRFYWKYIVVGFVVWVVILGFIQDGLKQIRAEQAKQKQQAP